MILAERRGSVSAELRRRVLGYMYEHNGRATSTELFLALRWSSARPFSRSLIQEQLTMLIREDLVERASGSGRRGDPYIYALR